MHASHSTAHGRGAVRGNCHVAHRANNVRHAPIRANAAAAPPVVPCATVPAVQLEDKFLAKNLPGLASQQTTADSVNELRAVSWKALPSLRMPTTRNEEYRYTDITSLLRQSLTPAASDAPVSPEFVAGLIPPEAAQTHVVLVNGCLRLDMSNTSALPKGAYVGGAAGAPQAALAHLGVQAAARGGPFSLINGAAARDVLVVYLPAEATLTTPLYVLHVSTSSSEAGSTLASAPRMLLHAGAGSSCSLVEEWVGAEAQAAAGPRETMPYFACAVAEMFLGRDAQVSHGYVVRDAPDAAHIKATLVEQEEGSDYALTEARLGGALTRHDVVVTQTGPRTSTTMRHFILAGPNQLHDLHTKLGLDHPEGVAKQLHKCIATAATARGVFDGNVRVGRLAQRSDAGQLSRNLLLAPRATVNIKPNLQIVADDVKCTHGCAVSDLSEEELFYFRARGINALAARQALVSSFGAEVTQHIKLPALQSRMQADARSKLQGVDLTTPVA